MYTIYGIKNCSTMKKAFEYMDLAGLDYHFVDYKKQAPKPNDLMRWADVFGELPVNKKGTTYRKIKDVYETANETEKITLLCQNASAIKRPILEGENILLKGFEPESWPKA